MFRRRFALLALIALTGCTEPAAVDCGAGQYYSDDTGRYCAYGVIVGGFTCPPALPYIFNVEVPSGVAGVCSDRPSGGPLPLPVCADLGAPEGCEGVPRPSTDPDGGVAERMPLPEPTPNCAPFFEPPEPGSVGGIRVGRHGTAAGTPLDELSDGDTVTVFEDSDGNPALALALQIGPEGPSSFVCYRVTIRTTFVDRGGVEVESPPAQYIAELNDRLAVVHDLFGPLAGSLDGEDVTLEIAVQEGGVEETRTITLELADP